jgi:hypothetical protein
MGCFSCTSAAVRPANIHQCARCYVSTHLPA